MDGQHFAYRAFYAIRSMNAPDGFPTNAIYGFIKTFDRMIQRVKPTHIAVLWDGGLDEERTESHQEYKAEREDMPDDMEPQLDGIVEWLEASGVFTWCAEGIEADDAIATLCWDGENAGFSVVIASSDKDFFQLINAGTRLLNPNDKTDTLWGPSQIEAKTGVCPGQIVDWLSLVGDAVDGIPGVPGVGVKTAAKLLNAHQSVDGIYDAIDSISSVKLRQKLIDSEQCVRRNQKLIALKKISGWSASLEDLLPREPDLEMIKEQYRRWNFSSLLQELE